MSRAPQEVDAILAGDRNALAGIDVLRKICNHPDLLQRASWQSADPYGAPERSGKLLVTLKVQGWRKSRVHSSFAYTITPDPALSPHHGFTANRNPGRSYRPSLMPTEGPRSHCCVMAQTRRQIQAQVNTELTMLRRHAMLRRGMQCFLRPAADTAVFVGFPSCWCSAGKSQQRRGRC